jgi:signal transduction histidine kinase
MPGHYQFEAFAIKPQSGLSSKPFIMNFTILPPWWQTWWFRTISVLACLAIITTVLRIYYINKLNQQKLQFEKKLIVEKERQHISREIHDHIGQALSVIKLNLNMNSPSEMADAKEMIGEVIQDMRQFTHGLYYGKLLTGSLADVIKKDVERLNIDDGLKASLDINMTCRMTDEHSELLIYRIFQEAINNILKHANAKNITVRLSSNQKQFKLTIIDDGKGFLEKGMAKGMGINSMHTRAELLNGDLIVSGKPNEGCKVELVISYA